MTSHMDVKGTPEFDPEVITATTRRQGGYIRIPPDLTDALDEQAEHRVLGRSKLIEMILRQWLKNLDHGS